MRALAVTAVPGSPTLTELPTPAPEAGELLVRVAATSVNGFDAATAAGMLQGMMEHRFPLVLGKDFAGTVEAVGSDVTGFTAGDVVFGVVMKPFLGTGSLGEYVTVAAGYGVTRVPGKLGVAEAGALGLAGTAALTAVEALDPRGGESVLIVGATGGVGALALQYAQARGAQVIATARPGAETDFVRDLAGDGIEVVDHSGDLAAQVRALAPGGVSAALHLAGDGALVADLVTDGGRFASTLGFAPEGDRLTATAVMADPTVAILDRLAADAVDGAIRVPVTRSYPLAEAAQAFDDFGAGAIGKLAITLS
ncbi:NADP-dependent oxidoreductase [Nonomuraea sp. NEAU-A123]|uniref:NADP-dependent oxidoreductase n=1 Tax=Nonomuraea sp. NEAU-A123 TaxID=2839649 RepID=UPI001BE4BB80|nr:NADP-dependent oxidoreductase [Nonomuraea sp. NEAU-A123]MBT2225236.1 NADP-dependent oxidoreductase [Nonomuraea sp. NEAU-A123]